MKIVIPTPFKKGLLLVLLGIGMQPGFTQCMNKPLTQEQLCQQIQHITSDKTQLKEFIKVQIGGQEPRLTQFTNHFFQKPDAFIQWLNQLASEQGAQQPQRKTVVQKKELTSEELTREFNKILHFAQNPREFSQFLQEQSGNVFIGYLSKEAIAIKKEELEQRFAFYRFLKPAAFSFGALSVVLAGWSWLKWTQALDKSVRSSDDKSVISKSVLLDRITELENRQKLLVQAGAITIPIVAPVQTGTFGSWFKGAAGLMSLGVVTLTKCAFSDIGMKVLTSWGLTPSAWLMRKYPFGELFSSVPSLNWVIENQTEFMTHAEMVNYLFRTDALFAVDETQTLFEGLSAFVRGEEKPKKDTIIEKNAFLAPFKKQFKEALKIQLQTVEKIKPIVGAFNRIKEQYCHKEQGIIIELAHNVGLFMHDIEKILGYIDCRMDALTSTTSKTHKMFAAAYQALYRLSNNFVYALRQGDFDEAFADFSKINKHLTLCKTIFR